MIGRRLERLGSAARGSLSRGSRGSVKPSRIEPARPARIVVQTAADPGARPLAAPPHLSEQRTDAGDVEPMSHWCAGERIRRPRIFAPAVAEAPTGLAEEVFCIAQSESEALCTKAV
jgi:hypothetical protein